ncbi:MAG: c-type cytochrome biogenesis protein CcsB [Desulfobacteraceae bacterium]|nr:MAG: c-type cytochrome biogenesis protein CcsB [Desulfobacteraceae bacterium]
MTSSEIFSIITFVYGAAAILYMVAWVFKKPLPGTLATATLAAAALGNLAGILLRWVESHQMGIGRPPLTNLYESLIFFALTIAVIYLFVEFKYKIRILGAIAGPMPFLAMAYASLPKVNTAIQPLIPALKSNWLIAHVMTCFIGYAAFTIAFGISIMFLVKSSGDAPSSGAQPLRMAGRIPAFDILDDLTHQMVTFGFLFLSIGIITGAVWANQAWGRYWGWDPKETWSLVTWLIYATLLHARLMRGWRGKNIAVLSCVGFVAMLFTYFGVNLLPGLHSYQ